MALRSSVAHLRMDTRAAPNADMVKIAIDRAIDWLLHNQSKHPGGGFSTFDFADGWTSPYPETTGYIAESMLMWPELRNQEKIALSAKRALDWLLTIQKPTGGWAGGYLSENKPEIVFNTGQVLRGMTQGYLYFKDDRYLNAATQAADWLIAIQNKQGYWDRHVYQDAVRVYDTYVAAPLYQLGVLTDQNTYKKAALLNAQWVINHRMQSNGWYKDADNTLKHQDKPILHTIAYTLDGLTDLALHTSDASLYTAVKLTATALRQRLSEDFILRGRYSSDWKGHRSICNTGVAQTSIIFAKLYLHSQDDEWKNAHNTLVNYLLTKQLCTTSDPDLYGAIPGSAPIWGRYEPFRLPNWGVKYLLDALEYNQHINHPQL